MKKISSLFLLALTWICVQSAWATNMEEVQIQASRIYVPDGFDSNDKVEVVVKGNLPNTCFRRAHGDAKIMDNRIELSLKAMRITDPNAVCIEAIVPYIITVTVGQLATGGYTLSLNPGTIWEQNSSLIIESPGSASIDNYTYANVLSVEKGFNPREIILRGNHPSSCMVIDRVDVIPNIKGDTFSVLPIVRQEKPQCDRASVDFSRTIQLPVENQADVVAHVRKLDGHALNYWLRVN